MSNQNNVKRTIPSESSRAGPLVFHNQQAIPGLKGFLLRAFLLTFVISGVATMAHAFDLGDALKQLGQSEDPTTGKTKEATSDKKSGKKPPSLTDLTDLVKGTSTEEAIAIGQ